MDITAPNRSQTSVLLLGAGASADAGIPLARQMLHDLRKQVVDLDPSGTVRRALDIVLGGIPMHRMQLGQDPIAPIDVEQVVSCLHQIADRRQLFVSPFVQGWNGEIDQLERDLAYRSASGPNNMSFLSDMSYKWSQFLTEQLGHSALLGAFDGTARLLTARLGRICQTNADKVSYLAPVLGAAQELGHRLTIATLNYDDALDVAADALGIWPFDEALDTQAPEGDTTLLRLHGSIVWQWEHDDRGFESVRSLREAIDPNGQLTVATNTNPVVIFGRDGKLTERGPFLDLFASFRRALRTASHVHVVGYSFRDGHINEWLHRWLRESHDRQLTVHDPALNEEHLAAACYSIAKFGDQIAFEVCDAPAALEAIADALVAGEATRG